MCLCAVSPPPKSLGEDGVAVGGNHEEGAENEENNAGEREDG